MNVFISETVYVFSIVLSIAPFIERSFFDLVFSIRFVVIPWYNFELPVFQTGNDYRIKRAVKKSFFTHPIMKYISFVAVKGL